MAATQPRSSDICPSKASSITGRDRETLPDEMSRSIAMVIAIAIVSQIMFVGDNNTPPQLHPDCALRALMVATTLKMPRKDNASSNATLR